MEQPLPVNGSCNLGSMDISKFMLDKGALDWEKLEIATRLGVNFMDSVIDSTSYPTEGIEHVAKMNRPVGMGIMGYADYLLLNKVAYGSTKALDMLQKILEFMENVEIDQSEILGSLYGVPEMCKYLGRPRRNITVNTIAPTGTISIIAGCSSGIEPIFSEITVRNDKTGTYTFTNDLASESYFRCAVASNGAREVTWQEHIDTLATAQKYIQSGVSKTINFPTMTHRDTISKAIMYAWESGCKGVAVYRNGSRKVEVLTPKNMKKDKCPVCGGELANLNGKKKCVSCKFEDVVENTVGAFDS